MKQKRLKSSRTSSLATLARPHAQVALLEIVRIATHSRSDVVRVAACNELLDRAYGKPPPTQGFATTDLSPPLRLTSEMPLDEMIARFQEHIRTASGSKRK